MTDFAAPSAERSDTARRWAWIGLLTLASLAFSRIFACAMPFAALATLAALNMRRGEAAALMIIVWAVNQAVGFLLLHYPQTAESFEWGAAIGVAGLASLGGAMAIERWLRGPAAATSAAAFAIAFILYEAVLYLNTLALHEGGAAFTPTIVVKILEVDASALALLLVLDWAAVRFHLIRHHPTAALA